MTDLKRGGNPAAIQMVKKYLKNPLGCLDCHAPNGAKPRMIRNALIGTIVNRRDGTCPYNKEKSKKVIVTKKEFKWNGKAFRIIAILTSVMS